MFLIEVAAISVRQNISVYLHIFKLPLTHELGLFEALSVAGQTIFVKC